MAAPSFTTIAVVSATSPVVVIHLLECSLCGALISNASSARFFHEAWHLKVDSAVDAFVKECAECGADVEPGNVAKHDAWHETLRKLIEAVGLAGELAEVANKVATAAKANANAAYGVATKALVKAGEVSKAKPAVPPKTVSDPPRPWVTYNSNSK